MSTDDDVEPSAYWEDPAAYSAAAQRDALRDDALAAVERMRAERDALAAILATVRGAVERHPEPCPVERDGGPVKCGWKRAVLDVRLALASSAAHSSAHSQAETHATHETHATP